VGAASKQEGVEGQSAVFPLPLSKRIKQADLLNPLLQYSFTREVEIVSSTLQPLSTVHSFSFSLLD
jgi:nicotinamide N-methyltransferase